MIFLNFCNAAKDLYNCISTMQNLNLWKALMKQKTCDCYILVNIYVCPWIKPAIRYGPVLYKTFEGRFFAF